MNNIGVTKEFFEAGYAERSGETVEWLHAHGLYAAPCSCGEDCCMGWKMRHIDDPPSHLADERATDEQFRPTTPRKERT